jgi:phage gpG-like protein
MPGVNFRLDASQASEQVKGLLARARNRERLLSIIGEHGVSETKGRIAAGMPGEPATHPYFRELKRRTPKMGDSTLYAGGGLLRSISKQVLPDSVRVGSPERYAATQQYGSGGRRSFYMYLIPDHEPGADPKRGLRYARNSYGFLLGRIVERQTPGAVKQLMSIEVRPRPFLIPPEGGEAERLLSALTRYLAGEVTKSGLNKENRQRSKGLDV